MSIDEIMEDPTLRMLDDEYQFDRWLIAIEEKEVASIMMANKE